MGGYGSYDYNNPDDSQNREWQQRRPRDKRGHKNKKRSYSIIIRPVAVPPAKDENFLGSGILFLIPCFIGVIIFVIVVCYLLGGGWMCGYGNWYGRPPMVGGYGGYGGYGGATGVPMTGYGYGPNYGGTMASAAVGGAVGGLVGELI